MSFIKYTVGLRAVHKNGTVIDTLSVEFSTVGDGVRLTPVSGRTLGQVRKVPPVTIEKAEFDERPVDPYDNVQEARWAFDKLGFSIAGDE